MATKTATATVSDTIGGQPTVTQTIVTQTYYPEEEYVYDVGNNVVEVITGNEVEEEYIPLLKQHLLSLQVLPLLQLLLLEKSTIIY